MNENIQYRLADIQIQSKELLYVPEVVGKTFEYLYDVSAMSRVNEENKLVLIIISIVLRTKDNVTLAKCTAAFAFEIVDFEKHITKLESGLYNVPDVYEQTFRQVSISTMRGIIYSELRGTYLHSTVMPVIMVDQLQPREPDETTELNSFTIVSKNVGKKE